MRRDDSVQRLVGLEDVARGCAHLSGGGAAAALACSSLPLALRDADEALAIVEALAATLRATTLAIQVLTEVRPLDVAGYLAAHEGAAAAEPAPALRDLAARQRRFVRGLADDRQLPEQRSCILLHLAPPATTAAGWRALVPRRRPAAPPPVDRRAQAGQLDAACLALGLSLRGAGIGARRLTDRELAGLLYRLLLPGLAERQPLPARLADLATGPPRHAGPPAREGDATDAAAQPPGLVHPPADPGPPPPAAARRGLAVRAADAG
jgi:hypothetical protein